MTNEMKRREQPSQGVAVTGMDFHMTMFYVNDRRVGLSDLMTLSGAPEFMDDLIAAEMADNRSAV